MSLPGPHTGSAAVLSFALSRLAGLAAVMVLIEFARAWYWPPVGDMETVQTRPFGGEFRALTWLTLLTVFVTAYILETRHMLRDTLGVLAPFLPFFLFGLLSLAWAVDRGASAKSLIIWAMVAGGLAAGGRFLSPEGFGRLARALFIAITLASLVTALVLPGIGIGFHYGEPVVKGLFVHKNSFGYFGTIGIIFVVALGGLGTWRGRAVLALLGAGVLASGSMTAVALAVLCGTYVLLLRGLVAHRAFRVPATVLALSLLGIGIAVLIFGREPLSMLLGRDPTFSGRTTLWAGFLDAFGDRIALGQGPGLFSAYSEWGVRIAQGLPGTHGAIGQPHNQFIALLGEVGVPGLLLFLAAHLWIGFIAPFRIRSDWAVLAAGMSLCILLRGLSEDNDGFQPSLAFIMIVLARAQDFRRLRG